MDFDDLAFQLLIELRKTPLATLQDLANRLQVSSNTIKSRIIWLKENDILRPDGKIIDPLLGEREVTEVVAHHSPFLLGLKRVHIVFENIVQYEVLFKVLSDHPFTYYQAMGMSHFRMTYAIMDIPKSTFPYLVEMLDRLKNAAIYHEYFLLDPQYQTRSEDNLHIWQMYSSWDTLQEHPIFGDNSIMGAFNRFLDKVEDLKPIHEVDHVPELDSLDLKLLRELTINSKVSPSVLEDIHQRDRTTLSRRLSRLKDNFITYYSIHYNRKAFNLDSTFIVYGHLDIVKAKAIYQLIDKGYIPYMCTYFTEARGYFIWHIFAPPSFVNEIVYNLLPVSDIHIFLVNPSNAVRYFFYPNNYDTTSKSWKCDREYFFEYMSIGET